MTQGFLSEMILGLGVGVGSLCERVGLTNANRTCVLVHRLLLLAAATSHFCAKVRVL